MPLSVPSHHARAPWLGALLVALRCVATAVPLAGTTLATHGALYGEQSASLANVDIKAVNTVCPVDGRPVDSSIPPITGRTRDGKRVVIGVCDETCAALVRAHPDRYADDAVANTRHGAAAAR